MLHFFRICLSGLLILLFFQSLAFGQSRQAPQQNALFTGVTLYENGQYYHAINHFTAYLNTSINGVQRKKASYYLALSQAAHQPDRSEWFFEQFIAAYPETELAGLLYIDLAHRAKFEGNLQQAVNYYARALELNLNEFERAQVLYWAAETSVSKRNYPLAHHYYERLSSEHPRSEWAPRALFNQGTLFLMQQQFDRATDTFEELRRRYPADIVVRRIGTAQGQAYYRQGRFREAIDSLRRVLATLDREQETKAVLIIAESYNYLNELNEASTWYRRYISLTEGSPEERLAHYGLGWVFHKQGVYHWAAESFSRVTQGNDELSRKALYYEAVNHKLSGRFDLALQRFSDFGRRYQTGPWVERAYYEWAILAFEIGDYVTAIELNLHLIRSGMELETPAEIFSLLGEAYFANGEYGRAIEAFERAESYGTANEAIRLQARFQRGWVLYRNQAYREAQAIFEQVYQSDPRGDLAGEALFWSADSFFNLGEYGPAAARFQRFLSEFRGHEFTGAARYSLGWAYFNMGQFEQALGPFRQFLNDYQAPPIALFPYDVDTKLRLGDSNFALRRFDDAINYYEMAMASEQGADYAKFQIANSFYRNDQTFESVRTFRQLILDFPGSTLREQAQYNIGYIFLLAANYTQAIAEFQRLIELFPNSRWAARSQFNIGNAYFNSGDNARAIQAYQVVLDRYPTSDLIIDAINGIQFAQRAEGQSDTSTEILEEFLTRHPRAGTADQLRFRQAERMLQTGDLDGAIEAFSQYIRVSSNQRLIPEAWLNIADAQERKGNRQEAVQALNTIVNEYSSAPQAGTALASLGRIALERRQFSEAFSWYERLLARGQQFRFTANVGMGNASIGLNRFEQARQYFEAARGQGGDQNLVNLGIGKVFMNTNREADALRELQVVADQSNSEAGAEAQYLIGRIYQRQRNHDNAIRAFANVRLFYSGFSDWVAKSLLGSAESNIAIGNRTEANQQLDLILRDYPRSEVAAEARRLRSN